MQNITPELIAKVKAAKSAEELLELAKENGVELTEEDAKTCFEQLHANAEISDDELEAVSGGYGCKSFENFFRSRNRFAASECPYCNDKSVQPNKLNELGFDNSITTLPADSGEKNKIDFL